MQVHLTCKWQSQNLFVFLSFLKMWTQNVFFSRPVKITWSVRISWWSPWKIYPVSLTGQLRDVLHVVLCANDAFFLFLCFNNQNELLSWFLPRCPKMEHPRSKNIHNMNFNLKYPWRLVFDAHCERLQTLWTFVRAPQVQHRALRLGDDWNATRTNCVSVLHRRPSCSPAARPGSVG